MAIKTKKISKFVSADKELLLDGKRLLIAVDSHWAKFHKMPFDEHVPMLGPSKQLWKAYIKDKLITWEEYELRFKDEIAKRKEAQELMKELAKSMLIQKQNMRLYFAIVKMKDIAIGDLLKK